jgi:branched-chain amino acid transport system ATP-binding protein
MSMLEIRDLTISYGNHVALDHASLSVEQGRMVAILGANGAGKSSLLGAIGGRVRPRSGDILYRGRSVLDLPAHRLVEEGIALVPEGRGIFPALTVEDNLRLGAIPARAREGAAARMEEVFALFPKLAQRRAQIAGTMSGGEQQMVAIGRALMSNPDLLLLDEPSLGLAPIVVKEVFAALSRIRATGLTILIVEQNARATLDLADFAYLMEVGRISGSGPAQQIKSDPAVIRAFLGGALAETR